MFDFVPLPDDSNLSESIRKTMAELPQANIFRLLAMMPNVLDAYLSFARALYSGKFDPKLRQLAMLRVAYRIPSNYFINMYVPTCKALGVSDEELRAIQSIEVSSSNEEIKFLCKVADQIALNGNLLDEIFHEFYRRYPIDEGTKFLMILAAVCMAGRFTNAVRLPIEKKSPMEGRSEFFKLSEET
jgi:alkylhydroperoxidase/carboxymuconolactone decarboxylase family protein YurZ